MSSSGSLSGYTLAQLLRRNAGQWGEAVALRAKSRGIWKEMSWAGCERRVQAIALGLVELGLARGSVAALLCRNCPELVLTQVAAQVAGAATLVLDADHGVDETAIALAASQAQVVVVQDEEQADKVLEAGAHAGTVRHIVYLQSRGLAANGDPRLVAMAEVERRGREAGIATPALYDVMLTKGHADDLCHLIATPNDEAEIQKLESLTNEDWMTLALGRLALYPASRADDYVCLESLSGLQQQVFATGGFLLAGVKLNFVEDSQTAASDLREVGPSLAYMSALYWRLVAEDAGTQLSQARGLRGFLVRMGQHAGMRALTRNAQPWLFDLLVGRAMRDRLGLAQLRLAITHGDGITHETREFFRTLGRPLHVVNADETNLMEKQS